MSLIALSVMAAGFVGALVAGLVIKKEALQMNLPMAVSEPH